MLPSVLVNQILEYKAQLCKDTWIMYLDKNDKIKYKINKYGKIENIEKVLLHKINYPPVDDVRIELNIINTSPDIFIHDEVENRVGTLFLYNKQKYITKYLMILHDKIKNQYNYLYYQYTTDNELNDIEDEERDTEEDIDIFEKGFYFENHCNNSFDHTFQHNILNNKSLKDPSKEIVCMFPKYIDETINVDDYEDIIETEVLEIGVKGHYLQEFIWYEDNWINIFEYHDIYNIDSGEYKYNNNDNYH
jgi:hypothetical protein